jgi:hypothetical protein
LLFLRALHNKNPVLQSYACHSPNIPLILPLFLNVNTQWAGTYIEVKSRNAFPSTSLITQL